LQGHRSEKYFRQIRPQTAAHARASRQLHVRGHRQQSCPAKTHKSHGHAVSLAARPRTTTTIQILLASWHYKQGGLLYQASPSIASPKSKTGNPDATQGVDSTSQNAKYAQLALLQGCVRLPIYYYRYLRIQ
jgi:hypothetical protein